MLVEERRQRVLDLVSQRGFVALTDLAQADPGVGIDAAPRSGLLAPAGGAAADARRGHLRRRRARRCRPWRSGRRRSWRRSRRSPGRPSARIRDGDAVLLDGGTTTLEVARLLVGRPMQIVTNSLPIANLFANSRETDLVMLGGYVYPKTGVALGPLTVRMMDDIHVHQADPERRRHHGQGAVQQQPAAGRDGAADDALSPTRWWSWRTTPRSAGRRWRSCASCRRRWTRSSSTPA